jgi:putative transposase
LISEKGKAKAKTCDFWIRLSTLEKGTPIYVPIATNEYFESILGERRNFCQVNLTEDNQVSFSFIKEVPRRDTYMQITDKIALDLGFSTLLASDRGDLFGRGFFAMLKKYDALITALAANRQQQGFKVMSRKYDNLIGNLREYLKNEINRVINRIVAIYSPAEIVVERLNFQNPNLSRRMNRLLSRFGKGILTKKLSSVSETYGIKITETNPAYSSQECSICGYVDKNNRKSQSVFSCECCDETIHVDVNAARKHAARSSGGMNINLIKQLVLGIVVQRFLQKLALLNTHADKDFERLFKRYDSLAKGLLPGNPYFVGYRAQLKGFS